LVVEAQALLDRRPDAETVGERDEVEVGAGGVVAPHSASAVGSSSDGSVSENTRPCWWQATT
jgi:hypothetical protein